MLLRTTDPFRDFDRLANQVLGTTNRPAVMPMDAWREGDGFQIEFDLPGCRPRRSTSTSSATCSPCAPSGSPATATGRCWPPSARAASSAASSSSATTSTSTGSRPHYDGGVLRLVVPVAERAKPRKIAVELHRVRGAQAIEA